jgi:hypothetical protein
MKLKDITSWEKEQKPENENKYIPGSSEKKRASMMYLFFGIFVSLSKKEFSPFELYHLKQAIGLRTLLLPIVLISFIPIIKWIWVFVLAILLWILAASFVNAFNWKYFDDSKNVAFTLPAGIWGWFLDLFELWIKSTWVDEKTENSNQSPEETPEIEKDIAENPNETTLDSLQTKETSLEEDIQTLDKGKESSDDVENK